MEVVGLATGGYYWRVAAVDVDGNVGPWSRVRRFSVNAGLPAGSSAKAPDLKITGQTPIGAKVLIRGMTSPDARVEAYMNGRSAGDVPVGMEGDFSVMLDATAVGRNAIRLVAVNKEGGSAEAETEYWYSGN